MTSLSPKINITLGADPEIFLEDLHGNLVSSDGIVTGTKSNPFSLGRDGYFVQQDNVALEFNIPPAASCQEFVNALQWSMAKITDDVERLNLRPKISAAEIFPTQQLMSQAAMVFGCEPDFNAWKHGIINPRPAASNSALRSCGGHVHVGINDIIPKSFIERMRLTHRFVQCQDLFLGVPSVMLDTDTMRRDLYGKAGCYRLTYHSPIAWEYRVLSNFWLKSQSLMTWVYTQTLRAIEFVKNHSEEQLEEFFSTRSLGNNIEKCINTSDLQLCQELIADYELSLG